MGIEDKFVKKSLALALKQSHLNLDFETGFETGMWLMIHLIDSYAVTKLGVAEGNQCTKLVKNIIKEYVRHINNK